MHDKHPFQGFLGGLAAQELARMLEGKDELLRTLLSFFVTNPFIITVLSDLILLQELEQRIRKLGPDFFDEEPDVSEALVDLDINYNQARNKQNFQPP